MLPETLKNTRWSSSTSARSSALKSRKPGRSSMRPRYLIFNFIQPGHQQYGITEPHLYPLCYIILYLSLIIIPGSPILQNRGIYMFRLDEDRVVDATISGGLARYINHSCNPNCVAETVEVERDLRIIIFTKRRINRGEEVNHVNV